MAVEDITGLGSLAALRPIDLGGRVEAGGATDFTDVHGGGWVLDGTAATCENLPALLKLALFTAAGCEAADVPCTAGKGSIKKVIIGLHTPGTVDLPQGPCRGGAPATALATVVGAAGVVSVGNCASNCVLAEIAFLK